MKVTTWLRSRMLRFGSSCCSGSCLFLFLCFLQCRPGLRLLLPAPTFATVSAAALRPRAPVRLLQRALGACRSKRFANWSSIAAASAAQAWREFQPGSGLLYLEANVRLLPLEFRDAFGLATPAAADHPDFRTAVLAALQTALDWYEHVVPA